MNAYMLGKDGKHQDWFVPDLCQLDSTPLNKGFVDGRLKNGSWCYMCPRCHVQMGVGLGLGRGQKYMPTRQGHWVKVES